MNITFGNTLNKRPIRNLQITHFLYFHKIQNKKDSK